jgi:hypothetical protein
MNIRIITTAAFSLIAGITFAQYSGQVATTMSSGGAAQGDTAGAIAMLLGPITDANSKRTVNWEEFQGSPYTSDDFEPAQLFYKNDKIGTIFYRHNALNEEIEIKESKNQQGIRGLNRDKNIIIEVDGKPMRFMTFIDKGGKTMNGYLTQLVKGENYDLYRRVHVKFTEGQKSPNSFVKATPSRFSQFTEYYVQKKGVDRIDELQQKNSKLYALAENPEQKQLLKAFLKDNRLDVDNEEDLVRLIMFLDRNS